MDTGVPAYSWDPSHLTGTRPTFLGPVPMFKNPQEYSHHPEELLDHHSAYVRSKTNLEMMSQDSAAPLWGTGRTLSAATLAHRGPIDVLVLGPAHHPGTSPLCPEDAGTTRPVDDGKEQKGDTGSGIRRLHHQGLL